MLEFLPIIFSSLFGLIAGIIAGTLPGLGILATVLCSIPILTEFTATQILTFYISLIISSQYFGSVMATFFGVPGEITSLPATAAGYPFQKKNKAILAILIAAIGSLFATIFTVIFLNANMQWIQKQTWVFSNKVQLAFCCLVIFYLIFSDKKYLQNVTLIFFGLVLGTIGNIHYEPRYNYTLGISSLSLGIDKNFIILMCFVVPQLFLHTKNNKIHNTSHPQYKKSFLLYHVDALCLWFKLKRSWLRGSIMGCVSGLLPSVGTSMSSNFSYTLEKSFTKRKSLHLMSAESANNSAMITSLVPLILFGLPIVASEAVILTLMNSKGLPVGLNWFMSTEHNISKLQILIIFSLAISCVSYVLATNFAFTLAKLAMRVPVWFQKYAIPCLLFFIFLYMSHRDSNMPGSLTTIAIATPLMVYAIRNKINTLPLIFAMLLAQTTFERIIVVFSL